MASIVFQGARVVAPIAWNAIGRGAAAAAGALGLNEALERGKQMAREQTVAPVVTQCYNCDKDQTCRELRRRIEGNYKELRERAEELSRNDGNLPYRAAGDDLFPRRSIFGHEVLFREHQDNLRKALQEFMARRCGVIRAQVWNWATMPVPKFGQPFFLP